MAAKVSAQVMEFWLGPPGPSVGSDSTTSSSKAMYWLISSSSSFHRLFRIEILHVLVHLAAIFGHIVHCPVMQRACMQAFFSCQSHQMWTKMLCLSSLFFPDLVVFGFGNVFDCPIF